jgi:hypothetical protein
MKLGRLLYLVDAKDLWYDETLKQWVTIDKVKGRFGNMIRCNKMKYVRKMLNENPLVKFEIDVYRWSNTRGFKYQRTIYKS